MEDLLDVDIDIGDKFRDIFDLCDVDNDGYVDVDHFKGLAKEHFGAESTQELTGIINILDPEGRGVINYKEFCQGIQQILELQQQAARRPSFQSSVSEETLVPLDIAGDLSVLETQTHSPSSSSQHTFAEYDLSNPDDLAGFEASSSPSTPTTNNHHNNHNHHNSSGTHLADLSSLSGFDFPGGIDTSVSVTTPGGGIDTTSILIPAISEDEADSALSGKSSEVNENSSRQEITDEENYYEDYGEMESEADVSDQGHLTPSSHHHHHRSKRSDRKDLLARHARRSPNHRLTASALASALQRSSRTSPSSTRRSSFGSDEIFDDIDGSFQDVNGRLKFLEDQLKSLTDVQTETNSKQIRLKDENVVLVQKVHYLEEQLRDMEVRSDDRINEERRKQDDYLTRQTREKNEQLDYLTQRLHTVESKYEELKEDAPRIQAEISKLRAEKLDIQERLLERQEAYNTLYEDHERLKSNYHRQETLHQKERNTTGQLLDEMGKELDDLRRYKIDREAGGNRSPSGSISELPGRYRDLQNEIHKLKEENRHLHDSNEELNAQLLTRCIGEGKSLLEDTDGQSLAQELEHLTKEELLAQLHMERDINMRLKQYVDRIIITILEKNPSLLEITNR